MAKRARPKKYNFSLNKSEFKERLHLRYGWEPPNTQHTSQCGQPFTLTHSLRRPRGGHANLRHNEVRYTFSTLLDEVCRDVELEPKLQSLEGECFHNKTTTTEDEARLDLKAKGLCPKTISDAYKYHDSVKTLKYQQRNLDVEHSSFVPLIFVRTGGAAPGSTKTFQKLAEKISEKRNE